MPAYKLGKREAVKDSRVPMFSLASKSLPLPPKECNWTADVGEWPMLQNDAVGDCVVAAIGHAVQQFSKYAGNPVVMSDSEAIAIYSAVTGYDPKDPSTDQGTYVLGQTGALPYWHKHGVRIGGVTNKINAFMQVNEHSTKQWMQGISIFGGILVGMSFPQKLWDMPELPFVWEDTGPGPNIGGHEIWINSYFEVNGERVYEFVSWGQRFRATEQFLIRNVDEVVVAYDSISLNSRGVDAKGFSEAALLSSMKGFA